MVIYLNIPVKDNCKALHLSYGITCVHCNCCGRYGKGIAMYEARIKMNNDAIADNSAFSDWWGTDDEIAIQKKNIALSKTYLNKQITYCKRMIKKLTKDGER